MTFYFFKPEDLVVLLTDPNGNVSQLAMGTDYAVTGNPTDEGYVDGGSITTTVPYADTYQITISRVLKAIQPISYAENSKFPAKSHEQGLDRLTMLSQQALRSVARSPRLGDTDVELNELTGIANTVFSLNGSKQAKLMTPSELIAFLNLATTPVSGMPIKVFSGSPASVVADYTGQLGVRTDTNQLYISTGIIAGNWTDFQNVAANISSGLITAAMLASTLDLSGKTLTLANSIITHALLSPDAISGQTSKASPISTDEVLLLDNAASPSPALKRATIASIAPQNSGQVLQSVYAERLTNADLDTHIPFDDSIPQITEGSPVGGLDPLIVTITPQSASNYLRIRFSAIVSSVADQVIAAAFQDSTANAVAVSTVYTSGGNTLSDSVHLIRQISAGTTSATTISIRVGAVSNTVRVNGIVGGRKFGGVSAATLIVEEIKA